MIYTIRWKYGFKASRPYDGKNAESIQDEVYRNREMQISALNAQAGKQGLVYSPGTHFIREAEEGSDVVTVYALELFYRNGRRIRSKEREAIDKAVERISKSDHRVPHSFSILESESLDLILEDYLIILDYIDDFIRDNEEKDNGFTVIRDYTSTINPLKFRITRKYLLLDALYFSGITEENIDDAAKNGYIPSDYRTSIQKDLTDKQKGMLSLGYREARETVPTMRAYLMNIGDYTLTYGGMQAYFDKDPDIIAYRAFYFIGLPKGMHPDLATKEIPIAVKSAARRITKDTTVTMEGMHLSNASPIPSTPYGFAKMALTTRRPWPKEFRDSVHYDVMDLDDGRCCMAVTFNLNNVGNLPKNWANEDLKAIAEEYSQKLITAIHGVLEDPAGYGMPINTADLEIEGMRAQTIEVKDSGKITNLLLTIDAVLPVYIRTDEKAEALLKSIIEKAIESTDEDNRVSLKAIRYIADPDREDLAFELFRDIATLDHPLTAGHNEYEEP